MRQHAKQEQPQTFQDCGGLRLTVAQYDSHTVIFSIAATTWSYNSLVPSVLLLLGLLVGSLHAGCHSLTGDMMWLVNSSTFFSSRTNHQGVRQLGCRALCPCKHPELHRCNYLVAATMHGHAHC